MDDEKWLAFSLESERFAMAKCGFCGHEDYHITRNKKFAELIVEECVAVMKATEVDADKRCTFMGDDVPTSYHIAEIQKHFGVMK